MQLSEIEFVESAIQNNLEQHLVSIASSIIDKIKQIEQQIIQLIHNDIRLSRLFLLITSVVGVGSIVGIKILLVTNEFKRLKDPKKLACQAGIVPFEHRSGTSVYKAASLSNMADHELKNLLHLAALAAIRVEGELKNYYQRKKQENKPSMSIINAVRNKIVHRICACVKADRIYQKDYQHPIQVA
ncbi:MAG: transposase [Bacteroidota bacterium]